MSTLPEPRLDEFWATRGEQLEDLSRVAAQQPWRADGPAITRTQLGGLRRSREEPLQRLAEVMGRAQHHVRAEATAGLAALTFQAWCAGSVSVVVATESPVTVAGRRLGGAEVADVADRLRVTEVPTGWLPVELAGWLGVGPAWSGDLEAPVVAMSTVTARVDDPEVPAPEGAGDLLRDVWRQPWWLWTVQTRSRGAIGVGAGERGQLQVTRDADDPDGVHLQSWPSASVWSTLRSLCLDWDAEETR